MSSLPSLQGVRHRFVELGAGATIHVAEAGPDDGPAVMLVHGFPQNWWEWRDVVGPLASDGYRVLCPDLPGAGWSSAPPDRYRKIDMADDLAAVLDRLGVGPVRLVAHDWGGPVSFIMMLRHPEKVSGYFGVNTVAPWLKPDLATLRHLWRFWYQIPIALPMLGPRVIADRKGRFFRFLISWVGGGFAMPEDDFWLYARRMREPGHAVAGSRWYRTFLAREFLPWLRGEYAEARVEVPVRWLHGTADPVLTPTLLRGYGQRVGDFDVELVDGVGHWFPEQQPELLVDKLREFLKGNT
ncbi:MAG TPA: alpha/beta hydrolase [Mycobacterium sp.]|uniref:alpha/beta fold hydrolase n=1 Tax=Mycobacterium sp. TaxID=1785 RepID=UPI002D38A261|nr:alpha/beta hydrolase [Mycobacterium sp.]HXY63615.1 alpha/beta hydrolase [Mycobacterium sp.]